MRRMKTVNDLIKGLRDAGLRQADIARRTGIHPSRVSRWGSGSVPDAAADALKLADLLDQVNAQAATAESTSPAGA